MSFTEKENKIEITNAIPTSDITGKKLTNTNQTFDFTINIETKSIPVTYEVTAENDTKSTLEDKDIKLYLEKSNDGTNYDEILAPTNYVALTANDEIGAQKGEMIIDTGKVNELATNNIDYVCG